MIVFKNFIGLIILMSICSCGGVTPAIVTVQSNHNGVASSDYPQSIDRLEDLASEYLKIKSIILPNNDIITVRNAPKAISTEAVTTPSLTGARKAPPLGIVLERYSSDLKLLWTAPLWQLRYAKAGHIFQSDNNTVCVVTAQESGKVSIVKIGIAAGNIIETKELDSDKEGSISSEVRIESSPDGSKICTYSFNTNSTKSTLRVFDQKCTLQGSFPINKNSVLQKAMRVTDAGIVYLIDTYKSNVMVARYDHTNSSNPHEMFIDLNPNFPQLEPDNILSILPSVVNNESIQIIAQYSDGDEPLGIALTDYDFTSKVSSVKTNFPLTQDVAQRTVNQSDFDEYYLNNAYFLSNGEFIILLEKKFDVDFTSNVVKNPTYMGKAPVYENVAAMKFSNNGEFQWGKSIDRTRAFGKPSRSSSSRNFYLYQTDETSALSTIYNDHLYIAHRERSTSNDNGFAISKISLDSGIFSSLNLPFTFGNAGFGVFFERNKTVWSSDGVVFLFTKETLENGDFGMIIKVNLDHL